MKNNRFLTKLAVLVAVSVTLLALIAPAYATVTIAWSSSDAAEDGDGAINENFINGTQVHGYAELFRPNATGYITAVSLWIRKAGTPTGIANVNLYTVTGTVGIDAYPNSILASSADIDVSAIDTTYAWVNYTLGTVLLASNQQYAIGFDMADSDVSTVNASHRIEWGYTTLTYAGNMAHDQSVDPPYHNYHFLNANDMMLIVYLNDDSYTPPSGGLTTWSVTIDSFVAFIVPLIVLFLPALLLCFITRRADKWLIIIGVTIGAGLGYYFGMVPLWLVFLVTIGLIGMAYQSVRGGGDS